ncbi:hypothetical protein [Hydrogenophaga sp.]|uniref:hypothetical protein n=1 Tax=Hydrogenophaga sp. TaxID=1904254 RepID=UPI003565A889
MSKWQWRALGLLLAAMLLSIAALAWLAGPSGAAVREGLTSRSANEWIRYAQKRLQGHPKLESVALPLLGAWQSRLERTPPDQTPLPTLGKGQQKQGLTDLAGPPLRELSVATPQDIRDALMQAPAGTRIVIAPGLYTFNQNLRLGHDGERLAPIVLSAEQPGSVVLAFSQDEGFLVDRPHWIFENLNIRGVCVRHTDCEHAFHVVGKAASTTLRNNHIQDFNAHIKVNGLGPDWPDHGWLAFNTLTNTAPRDTDRSVVPFDLVGASHWRVQDNLVSQFSKLDGNQVSFGMFMKGASEGGIFERNLVICSPTGISRPGVRVGISFGGGGTDPASCRTQQCLGHEHTQGLAANNVVAHCNDAGLDINHATDIVLAHNTLINTAGITARRAPARALLYGNLLEGGVYARDGSTLAQENNLLVHSEAVFRSPDALQLQWKSPPDNIPPAQLVTKDFFDQPRGNPSFPGATGPTGELLSQ